MDQLANSNTTRKSAYEVNRGFMLMHLAGLSEWAEFVKKQLVVYCKAKKHLQEHG